MDGDGSSDETRVATLRNDSDVVVVAEFELRKNKRRAAECQSESDANGGSAKVEAGGVLASVEAEGPLLRRRPDSIA